MVNWTSLFGSIVKMLIWRSEAYKTRHFKVYTSLLWWLCFNYKYMQRWMGLSIKNEIKFQEFCTRIFEFIAQLKKTRNSMEWLHHCQKVINKEFSKKKCNFFIQSRDYWPMCYALNVRYWSLGSKNLNAIIIMIVNFRFSTMKIVF